MRQSAPSVEFDAFRSSPSARDRTRWKTTLRLSREGCRAGVSKPPSKRVDTVDDDDVDDAAATWDDERYVLVEKVKQRNIDE